MAMLRLAAFPNKDNSDLMVNRSMIADEMGPTCGPFQRQPLVQAKTVVDYFRPKPDEHVDQISDASLAQILQHMIQPGDPTAASSSFQSFDAGGTTHTHSDMAPLDETIQIPFGETLKLIQGRGPPQNQYDD